MKIWNAETGEEIKTLKVVYILIINIKSILTSLLPNIIFYYWYKKLFIKIFKYKL